MKKMVEQYAIYTQDLTKSFGNVLAVDKINLKIQYGTTYGLLGPNGAGKTTTVRMLNAIITSTTGSAKVCGYDVATQSKQVKINCGFLPEAPGLYQKLTAKEFLEFIGELYYLPKLVINTRIIELLEIFEVSPPVRRFMKLLATTAAGNWCRFSAISMAGQVSA